MSKLKGVVLCLACLAVAGIVTTAQAAETKYKVSVDYLNWNVNRGEMDYAYPDSGSVSAVDPDSDDGFRFAFEVMRGQATYRIAYTNFEVEEEDDVRGSGMHGTLIIDDECNVCQSFDFASANYDTDYSMIDLGLGYQLRPDSKFGLEFIGGLSFGEIEEEYGVIYADTPAVNGSTDTVLQENEVEMFGVYLGMVPSYAFHDRFSVVGRANFSPMMADIDRTFVYRTGSNGTSGLTTEFDVEADEEEIVNKLDFEVGVEWTPTDWLSVEAGYEYETWLNYPSFLKVTSESGEETIDRGGDGLAFDGFFIRLGYTF